VRFTWSFVYNRTYNFLSRVHIENSPYKALCGSQRHLCASSAFMPEGGTICYRCSVLARKAAKDTR
jgi:hypothetical protein